MCWIGNGEVLPRGVPQGDRETLYIARVNQNHFVPLLRGRQRGGEIPRRDIGRNVREASLCVDSPPDLAAAPEAEEARTLYGMESISVGTAYTVGGEGADAGSAPEVDQGEIKELQEQQQPRPVRTEDLQQAQELRRGEAAEAREQAAMGDADLEAEAWRAAAACEMEEASETGR